MKQSSQTSLQQLAALQDFIHKHPRLVVLTGAGLSHNSGIPTYRDHQGQWQRREPIQHHDFMQEHATRQRYWARSILGWHIVNRAKPNNAHRALAQWEQAGRLSQLVTQNVDGLHRAAGSNNVLELHGRIDRVRCLNCHGYSHRADIQQQLINRNPELWRFVQKHQHQAGPDGDADVDDWDVSQVQCPLCPLCGGDVIPDVVFFGGTVPKARVELVYQQLQSSDALLVIGSSLMVFSGYRFCKYAAVMGKPIAAINQGLCRADDLLTTKLEMDCGEALRALSV